MGKVLQLVAKSGENADKIKKPENRILREYNSIEIVVKVNY